MTATPSKLRLSLAVDQLKLAQTSRSVPASAVSFEFSAPSPEVVAAPLAAPTSSASDGMPERRSASSHEIADSDSLGFSTTNSSRSKVSAEEKVLVLGEKIAETKGDEDLEADATSSDSDDERVQGLVLVLCEGNTSAAQALQKVVDSLVDTRFDDEHCLKVLDTCKLDGKFPRHHLANFYAMSESVAMLEDKRAAADHKVFPKKLVHVHDDRGENFVV
jgi:hypothetical protein